MRRGTRRCSERHRLSSFADGVEPTAGRPSDVHAESVRNASELRMQIVPSIRRLGNPPRRRIEGTRPR